jgi:hypothetical protein
MNAPLPSKLLTISHTRRLAHYSPHTPHMAAFVLPDGTELKGMPAASKADAVHNVFEAETGQALPKPFEHHFMPLCEAVLALCQNVSWCTLAEARLLDQSAILDDWQRYEAKADIERYFQSFQGAVASAHEVMRLLNAHAADPDGGTMRDHPLTAYADLTGLLTMCFCKVLCDPLGIPSAVVARKGTGGFDVHFDPHDSEWDGNKPTTGGSTETPCFGVTSSGWTNL